MKCYVCGKEPANSHMILYNGVKKPLCSSCYKNHVDGIKIYQENNPDWEPPTER